MDNLQWFKFSPADWMMGRIQRQPAQVQVDFIRICCKYWQKDGVMSIEDAEIEAMDSYDTLVKYKVIKVCDDNIVVDFLDEQLEALEGKRKQASDAGKRSAEVRKHNKEFNDRSTTVDNSFNENEQSRVEEIREDKNRVDNNKEIRELDFRKQVAQLSQDEYINEEFCDYWTESKPNGVKMKFEMQKTFDIERRLKTWKRNDFSNQKSKQPPSKDVPIIWDEQSIKDYIENPFISQEAKDAFMQERMREATNRIQLDIHDTKQLNQ